MPETETIETHVTAKLDIWAKVELMGHQRLAGHVTEATIAGGAFIRVDVPAVRGISAQTRYFNPSAIYCITPVTEDIARGLAEEQRAKPVNVYDLPSRREEPLQLEAADDGFPDNDDPTDDFQYDRSARGGW